MAWITMVRQIADQNGNGTGRYRMTAWSDEGGGGPYGDTSHDHSSAQEAEDCEQCDEFIAGVTGFPSRKKEAQLVEARDRAEYERLKAKFEAS